MSDYQDEDLATDKLDRYLIDGAPRRLKGNELKQAISRLFEVREDPLTELPRPEDHPHRTLTLWRLTRLTVRVCGLCGEDETLDIALHVQKGTPDPWKVGIKPSNSTALQENLIRRGAQNNVLALYHSDNSDTAVPIPLLPSPNLDKETLQRWHALVMYLATDLAIESHDIGHRGMRGLYSPESAQHAGVTPKQIMALEDLLVDEAQSLIIKVGERPTVQQFRERYGFTRLEALALMRLARAEAARQGQSTIDEDRAIMVAILKDYLARTKQSLNQRDELAAIKELGRVQGLSRTLPEDAQALFAAIVDTVAQKQDKQLQEQPRTVQAYLTQKSRQIDEDDPDDDPEALKAFDREKNMGL